jgi:hypothetical protein
MVDFVMYSMFSHANLLYRTGGMKINVNVNVNEDNVQVDVKGVDH